MNDKYTLADDKGRKELKFKPKNLVWVHLTKERFLELCKFKLLPPVK
jgi:hypothetical protein